MSLSRPGIRSCLPARLGTQKLWITSFEFRVDVHRHADRQVKLVGGAHHLRRVGAVVGDVPPPLVAGDGDRQLLVRGGVGHRPVGEEAGDRERDQPDADQRAPSRSGRCASAGRTRGAGPPRRHSPRPRGRGARSPPIRKAITATYMMRADDEEDRRTGC